MKIFLIKVYIVRKKKIINFINSYLNSNLFEFRLFILKNQELKSKKINSRYFIYKNTINFMIFIF